MAVLNNAQSILQDVAELQDSKPPLPKYLGFNSGIFSAITKNAVGHPFHTVKVRLQTSEGRFKGPMECVFKTFRSESIRGFFKGFNSPLFG